MTVDNYIQAVNGFVTVLLPGVVHEGKLVFQQHLDAADCPGPEEGGQGERFNTPGEILNIPAASLAVNLIDMSSEAESQRPETTLGKHGGSQLLV